MFPKEHKRTGPGLAALGVGLLLLVVVLALGGGRAAASPSATIVRCDPATVVGPIGGAVNVDIYVENVVELYAADVRLSFDTTALQVVDADPDPNVTGVQIQPLDTFLSPDYVVRRMADNDEGTIWYAATQMNPAEAVSGSGPLARITFRALRPGAFTLPITYYKLVRRNSLEIPATAQGCAVTFVEIDSGGVTFVPFTAKN